jgi:predicted transcriptional regulator
VDLDALDLSALLPLTEVLLRSLEDYQRHAAAARFRVTIVAVSAWQSGSMAALAVEAELSRLGVTADLPTSIGFVERLRAVEGLREWLLIMRGKDWQDWGVRGWQLPGPLPQRELPDLACPLAQLREIVRDLRVCAASTTGGENAAAKDSKEIPAVDHEDVVILRALAKQPLQLLTQDQIEAASNVSRKTISTRIKSMLATGLVIQPKGPKSGTTITPDGKKVLAQIDGPKNTQ